MWKENLWKDFFILFLHKGCGKVLIFHNSSVDEKSLRQ